MSVDGHVLQSVRPSIAACLAFWRESPETLTRCVSSLVGVCEYLVALDGPWDLMPHDSISADPAEVNAIIKAASAGAGKPNRLKASVHFTQERWESQVAKRAELMRLGAETGCQFLMVIDGDEWIEFAHEHDVHDKLEASELDVALVTSHRIGMGVKTIYRPMRRIYRASTGVTVQTAHNGYVTADGRWLHGDPAYVTLEEPLDLDGSLVIAHDLEARTGPRRRAQLDYRANRRKERSERWR